MNVDTASPGRKTNTGQGCGDTVVDVPVIMQRKFQQVMPIDIEVPQILFIARVLDIPVMPLRRVRTVQTADSTAQLLGNQLTRPLFFNDRSRAWFSRSAIAVLPGWSMSLFCSSSTRCGRPRDLAATSSRSSRRQSEVAFFRRIFCIFRTF